MGSRPRLVAAAVILLVVLSPNGLRSARSPAEAVVPGNIRTDVTFEHIGVLWWIEGDTDLDSTMSLEFRSQGDIAWRPGAPAMRAYPTLYVQDGPLGLNYWAASALFLDPGETYELRLTLSDPDGGGETRVTSASTRVEPQADSGGRELFAIPGGGGGDGSSENPFLGLQSAADAAQPGDRIHVASGSYDPFSLLAGGVAGHPIAFLGPGDGSAIINGEGTDRGVVTLGEYDQTIGHVIIQGLSMQNGSWGIDAQHSHDIVIRDNTITDVDYGVINRRGDGLESNQTVCDNVVEGRTEWPGSGIPSERGIDLRGYGNVVCHNQVRYFGDCISLQPFTGPSYGNDVFGNDVAYCVDDGIEIDYNQANVRVWRNRVTNARMGVSLQPIRGGPAYVLRNEFFNLESVPIKMHNYTAGFIVVHNSGAKHGNGYGDNGAMWRNAILRNNLFLGTRYAFEFTTVADEGFRDFDYNAWGTTREIDPGGPFFKWDDVRFATLGDLPPGVEDHGVEAAFGDLLDGALPADWDVAVGPGTRDLRLRAGAPEIDAGVDLPNLNNGFAISGAPDAGAFETGQALPHYGPRSVVPDLSGSSKRADRLAARLGDTLSFTILIQNAGAPLNGPIVLTDTLPSGLSYVSDTLTATSGAADDTLAPVLRWTGELDGNSEITLTYGATVVEEARRVISNTATIDAGPLGSLNLSAMLIVNGYSHFLPVCYSRSSP